MKVLLLAAMITATFAVQQASAGVCNMSNCQFGITSDSGYSVGCAYTSYLCNCADIASYKGVPYRIQFSSPGPSWVNNGNMVGTTNKCWTGDFLAVANEHIKSSGNGSIEELFAPAQATAYYGYVSTTNRSPNAGRTQSAEARLDVCMGSNDTNAAIATNNATTCGNQYCGSGPVNEYCNANNQAVCRDRCECAIPPYTGCDYL